MKYNIHPTILQPFPISQAHHQNTQDVECFQPKQNIFLQKPAQDGHDFELLGRGSVIEMLVPRFTGIFQSFTDVLFGCLAQVLDLCVGDSLLGACTCSTPAFGSLARSS